MSEVELPEVERVQALRLHPDDIVLVSVPADTSMQQVHAIREHIGDAFDGHRVMILAGGIIVGAVGPDDLRECDCCGRMVPADEIATTGPTFAADEAQACEQCRGAVV